MAKVIVTGGAGMIGSNLVKKLINHQHEVLVIDNLWRGKLEYLYDEKRGQPAIDFESQFFNIDLSLEISNIEPFTGTEYIIHLADIVAGIGYVFNNQGSIFRQNILINTHTIELAKKLSKRVYLCWYCLFLSC